MIPEGSIDNNNICTRRAGKLYRARSRLYRSRLLQGNAYVKASAEIYKKHPFAMLSNPNCLSKPCRKIALKNNYYYLSNVYWNFSEIIYWILQNVNIFCGILSECSLPESVRARVETQGRRVPSGAERGRLQETIDCICTRPICRLLASNCSRPAAAVREQATWL